MGNYKGKNVDEAISNGLSELNLNKSEVKINIIDHGNAGVFGFFEKEAEVEITPLSPMELKIKRLIPYLIGAVTIFMILIAVIIGVYSDKSTTVSPLPLHKLALLLKNLSRKLVNHPLHHQVRRLLPLVQLTPHQARPKPRQQVHHKQLLSQ